MLWFVFSWGECLIFFSLTYCLVYCPDMNSEAQVKKKNTYLLDLFLPVGCMCNQLGKVKIPIPNWKSRVIYIIFFAIVLFSLQSCLHTVLVLLTHSVDVTGLLSISSCLVVHWRHFFPKWKWFKISKGHLIARNENFQVCSRHSYFDNPYSCYQRLFLLSNTLPLS